jgi:hypothetical protein
MLWCDKARSMSENLKLEKISFAQNDIDPWLYAHWWTDFAELNIYVHMYMPCGKILCFVTKTQYPNMRVVCKKKS